MTTLTGKRSSSKLSDSLSTAAERTAKRRKRTNFSDYQLDRLEEAFRQDKFPGIARRDDLARELAIGEDRVHVWFQNRRSRWRKREIKNQPAPVSSAPLSGAEPLSQSATWAPSQLPEYYHPPHFRSSPGSTHIPTTNDTWSFTPHMGPAYFFQRDTPPRNFDRSSAFTGPSMSVIYAPNVPASSPSVTDRGTLL